MFRSVSLGVVAAFFFSSTFVLNRWMSVEGGHWFWTAALRYGYVFILLTAFVGLWYGISVLRASLACVHHYWRFWIFSGGVGFACFYSTLCFAANYAPGWVIATTWQSTILASPLVLFLLGKSVPIRGVLFTSVTFVGIVLVNASEFPGLSLRLAGGVVPVMIAAICYPLGNTLCRFAQNGGHARVPHIHDAVMQNTFCIVWMMTAGALPVLAVLGLLVQPPPPTTQQLVSTVYVAISTGIVATTIFLYARNNAKSAFGIAAVDATQAGEVLFAFFIEYLFLNGRPPSYIGIAGLTLVVGGLVFYALSPDRD